MRFAVSCAFLIISDWIFAQCVCVWLYLSSFFFFLANTLVTIHTWIVWACELWHVLRLPPAVCCVSLSLCLFGSLCHSITICVWATKPTNSFALDQASVRDINIMICLLLLFVYLLFVFVDSWFVICVCFVAIWPAIKWIKICLHLRNNFTFVMQLQS